MEFAVSGIVAMSRLAEDASAMGSLLPVTGSGFEMLEHGQLH